jgi:transposase InsO family protein
MPWMEADVLTQRIEFVVLAHQRSGSFSEWCRQFGISRKTGYKWLKLYEQTGRLQGLEDRSRRPHQSPGRTSPELEQRVVDLRQQYGWGGRKLQVLLQREGVALSAATIDRILKRRDLVRRSPKGPAPRRFERSEPNQLWQMDFKGDFPLQDGGRCHPLSLVDDASRYAVGLYGLASTRHEAVAPCVVECLKRYGVPEAMLMDHGTPWWSTTGGYGLTRLSVQLIQQGIHLIYSGVGHPQTQGKVERFHRSLEASLRHHGLPDTLEGFRSALGQFRRDYNEVRPHEALLLEVPQARYRPSSRAYNPHPSEWQYPAGADVRRLNSAGCLDYQRRRFFVCEALAEQQVWCQPFADRILVHFRHMTIREINVATGRTTAVVLPVAIS